MTSSCVTSASASPRLPAPPRFPPPSASSPSEPSGVSRRASSPSRRHRSGASSADLCKSLLHECPLRPSLSEGAHVLEVARREAFHLGKRLAQVRGQPVDHLRTAARAILMNTIARWVNGSGGMRSAARWGLGQKNKTLPEARRLIRQGVDTTNVALGRHWGKHGAAGLGVSARQGRRPPLSGTTPHTQVPSGWLRSQHPASPPRPAARASVQQAAAFSP